MRRPELHTQELTEVQRDHGRRGTAKVGFTQGKPDRQTEHSGLGKDFRGIAEVNAQVLWKVFGNGVLGCRVYCEKQQVSAEEGI